MGYEREVLIRAKNRYQEAIDDYRRKQRQAQEKIYRELPEAAQLDSQIRATMADLMTEALRHGNAPAAAIGQIREKNLALQKKRDALIEKAGLSLPAEGPMCRKCSDTGYIGEKMCSCFQKFCQEEQQKELYSMIQQDVCFDDFCLDYYPTEPNRTTGLSPRAQMELVYESCVNYASHFSPEKSTNLLMSGDPGLGKTFLSACIAREVIAQGCSVVYDTASHLFSCLEKQKFGGATEEELRLCERIYQCDLLILDDLGTEMTTAFVSSSLYSIVNGRILSASPTIISTNYSMETLAARYTPQIASRLAGDYARLIFAGQDIRRLKSRK